MAVIKNLAALHAATVEHLGFRVTMDAVYERLYNQGEPIPAAALDALLPDAENHQLMSVRKGPYELELCLWSSQRTNHPAMLRVNLRATPVGKTESEEVDVFPLHDYINIIEAVGVFRLAVKQFQERPDYLGVFQILNTVSG